jgi:hypothetical protein
MCSLRHDVSRRTPHSGSRPASQEPGPYYQNQPVMCQRLPERLPQSSWCRPAASPAASPVSWCNRMERGAVGGGSGRAALGSHGSGHTGLEEAGQARAARRLPKRRGNVPFVIAKGFEEHCELLAGNDHRVDEEGRCDGAEDSADRRGRPLGSLGQPTLRRKCGNGNLFPAGTSAELARPRRPDRHHRRHVAGAVHQLIVTVVPDHAATGAVLRRLTLRLTAQLTAALATTRLVHQHACLPCRAPGRPGGGVAVPVAAAVGLRRRHGGLLPPVRHRLRRTDAAMDHRSRSGGPEVVFVALTGPLGTRRAITSFARCCCWLKGLARAVRARPNLTMALVGGGEELVEGAGEQLDSQAAHGAAGGLGQAGEDGLVERVVVADGEAAQLGDGGVVVASAGGQGHRPARELVRRRHGRAAVAAWPPASGGGRGQPGTDALIILPARTAGWSVWRCATAGAIAKPVLVKGRGGGCWPDAGRVRRPRGRVGAAPRRPRAPQAAPARPRTGDRPATSRGVAGRGDPFTYCSPSRGRRTTPRLDPGRAPRPQGKRNCRSWRPGSRRRPGARGCPAG